MHNQFDHTILILTRNRPHWIDYSLNFYKFFNYRGEILLADDSDKEFFLQNQLIHK